MTTKKPAKANLLGKRTVYKPFAYPWAYSAWEAQQKAHWIAEEVPMHQDIRDWETKLTPSEKNLVTQIFRFFTQGDLDISCAYRDVYMPIFGGNPEVDMMLAAFKNMESIHVAAYSTLLDTLGLPEVEYQAFMEYDAMRKKHEYTEAVEIPLEYEQCETSGSVTYSDLDRPILDSPERLRAIAKALAIYSGFTEGMQLFSSFAILLNFSRFNKLKGMCAIVAFSIKDETLHTDSMIKLFRQFIKENPSIWTDAFKGEIYQVARDMVELEDKFIDLAFEMGPMEGLTAEDTKQYVRYIADRRLLQLGLKANFGVKKNPLDWLDWVLNGVEHANFFETRATEYTKASTQGTWDTIWNAMDSKRLTEANKEAGISAVGDTKDEQ
jgi:ribonucleoside-diphosphate reductase beta chain